MRLTAPFIHEMVCTAKWMCVGGWVWLYACVYNGVHSCNCTAWGTGTTSSAQKIFNPFNHNKYTKIDTHRCSLHRRIYMCTHALTDVACTQTHLHVHTCTLTDVACTDASTCAHMHTHRCSLCTDASTCAHMHNGCVHA